MKIDSLSLLIGALLLSSAIAGVAGPLLKIARCLERWHTDYQQLHGLNSDTLGQPRE